MHYGSIIKHIIIPDNISKMLNVRMKEQSYDSQIGDDLELLNT